MRRIFPSTTRCWKTTRMMMDDELTKTLKYLRLSGLMAHWDEYLAVAQKQRFSHVRLLRYVLEEEFKIRSENPRKLRPAPPTIPQFFLMQPFPLHHPPN